VVSRDVSKAFGTLPRRKRKDALSTLMKLSPSFDDRSEIHDLRYQKIRFSQKTDESYLLVSSCKQLYNEPQKNCERNQPFLTAIFGKSNTGIHRIIVEIRPSCSEDSNERAFH
jgi:hypothetical protein